MACRSKAWPVRYCTPGHRIKGHAMAVPLQHILKRIGSDQTGIRVRLNFNQAFGRIESMETDL